MSENDMNENEEIEEPMEEVIEEEKEQEVWRVTTMKANGSVWTKTYTQVEDVGNALYELVYSYPHIIISRQTLKTSPSEYRRNNNGEERQKS